MEKMRMLAVALMNVIENEASKPWPESYDEESKMSKEYTHIYQEGMEQGRKELALELLTIANEEE